ncbi:embryo defective [Abeliophyllum distichum]|uniref:Embryo defective n=1 Tax=Abeliophyllum distichum TaxID=126358 RepID=A0ABD1SW41_9LAMI
MNKSSDFKFWDGQRSKEYYQNDNDSGHVEDEFTYCSPPLWTKASRNSTYHCHYRFSSPGSRLQAIADSRRELMEMIKDMPESSYELSFKDILEDQQSMEVEKKKNVRVETNQKCKTGAGNSEKCKSTRRRQISRSESMESGVFLLKMFLPLSLGSKKSKRRICGNVSPELWSEGSTKRSNKGWWKTIFLAAKDNKNRPNINSCSSDISSGRNRLFKRDTIPGWWSFNSKSCISGGCLF